ncbi:MAG: histidine phosphatase [Oleiphilus sp.]|nr:MAG: histidine phosphatase [Oleiphilus sp.]
MGTYTLFLVRHAKSSWKDATLLDRQRPLNKRGHRNAPEMARHLANHEQVPDHFISSPAKRALNTAQYFANELAFASFNIQIEERLYFCGIKGWLNTLKQLPITSQSAILFGHNPDISLCLAFLTGREIEAVPTCTIAKLRVQVGAWPELKEGCGLLEYIISPKNARNPSPLQTK